MNCKKSTVIKNLNCYQLRNNSDHTGWLHYLREELNEISKKFSTNFQSTQNEQVKWKENYLILKHDLLYFYLNDEDEQQPCRIINLPSFDLTDELDYRAGMHVFKIKSSKYAFSFASEDLNTLNEWINKFKIIFSRKGAKEPNKSTISTENESTKSKITIKDSKFKLNTNQYYSFNSNHSNYLNKNLINQIPEQFRLTHSVKDLNLDENKTDDKMKCLNNLMSKSTNQIKLINNEKIKISKLDNDQQLYRLGAKYFSNGSYSRSQSCIDSNFINKYTKARMMNKEMKATQLSNQSMNQLTIDNNSFLPPTSSIKSPKKTKKSYQSMNSFYLDQKYSNNNYVNSSFNRYDQFSKQNLMNQLNEQNQLNSQQEQELNQKKEIPKPQPRISKMKEQNNANFVGKIISEFDELSKVCEKELEHYSSLRKRSNNNHMNNKTVNEMNNINLNFNSYPRNLTSTVKKDFKKNDEISIDNEIKSNESMSSSNDNQQSISILDHEYNRLFNKNPPNIIKTATSKEIQSIYLKQYDSVKSKINHNLTNLINNSINIAPNTMNAEKLRERCNSPISDHSLSSSSGISSYYSMGQDVQTVKHLSNLSNDLDAFSSISVDKSTNTSTNNFSFSPNSKNLLIDHQMKTSSDDCDAKLKVVNDSSIDNDCQKKLEIKSNEKNTKKEGKKSVQRKSSFNSFRLFGSSKMLSKLSSSKLSSEDEKVLNKSKSFLTSPRSKRSFFGLRKNSLPNSTLSTAVQTEDNLNNLNSISHLNQSNSNDHYLNRTKSKSTELLNNYYMDQSNQKNRPGLLTLSNKLSDNRISDNYIEQNIPQTPETHRKPPTMGLKMLNKRRSSSVSCDKVAIETAFQMYNEKMNSRVSS